MSANYYAVITNSDCTEGRGYPVVIGVSDNLFTARRFAKGNGVQGTDADIVPIEGKWVEGKMYYPASCVTFLASTAGERLEQRESEEKEALERVRALRMNDLKAQVEAAGLDWEYVVETMAK